MKKIALAALLALALIPAAANAAAHPVATATQIGPRTFILDASASPCAWRYCAFAWRAYGPSTNRLGMTAGYDATIIFVAPSAGSWNMVVTESEFCNPVAGGSNRTCPGTASVFVRAT